MPPRPHDPRGTSLSMRRHQSIAANGSGPETPRTRNFSGLTLGCIGVVYGDIGTSPLYALRESVLAGDGRRPAPPAKPVILGILSLIIWALILIVTVKYVLILLRADNNGEGGTLALMALAQRALGGKSYTIILLGMISAALFYGDAMITPALSVLSAVEGLEVVTPALRALRGAAHGVDPVRLCSRCSRAARRGLPPFSARSRSSGSSPLRSAASAHIAQNPGVLARIQPGATA